ncbi:ribonuclease R [Paraphotobacterium marinum]|uniref:Ribonuclease R n=1 Tax=Paraphotobacterium marinum TaxID=1755811 RepID=A0A220VEB2_9GAMM|nr:ribonuclease R [Paraphotobacterium marinum]ASK78263.1 ribonuclease R [Paraphotobacterium marinum]
MRKQNKIQKKTDPFKEREAKNYSNPVPSREFIVETISNCNQPVSKNLLLNLFSIKSDEEKEAFRRRLKAMERDGQLVYYPGKKYCLPIENKIIEGTIQGHKDGIGILKKAYNDQDVLISQKQMVGLLHGDIVKVQIKAVTTRGMISCDLIEVVKFSNKPVVGRFFIEHNKKYVVSDDSRVHGEFTVIDSLHNELSLGNVVVLEITKRATKNQVAEGKVIEVLGNEQDPGIEIDIALRKFDIPYQWPKPLLKELDSIDKDTENGSNSNRIDLRNKPFITIDGEDARDFDDAVYCESKPSGGWRLWVAIADVSHYIKKYSELDKEALKRGNSVYFPQKVVPMLPELLSNGVCSLNPNVNRLSLVCEMTISKKGKLSGYKFYEGLIKSSARLTYNKVSLILDNDYKLLERYANNLPNIYHLHSLYTELKKQKEIRGALEFDTNEPKFVFNEHKKIESIETIKRNDAHKIIEECMILANVASAKFLLKNSSISGIYRVHDKPSDEKLSAFNQFLLERGLSLANHKEPKPSDYSNLNSILSSRTDKEIIQTMLLRSLKQANYQTDNIGHFGLSLNEYTHFTSPIRRYPDLIVHRLIKSIIYNDEKLKYSPDEIDYISEHCSTTERKADEATKDVAEYLKCEFISRHIGETFEGIISNVLPFGFFVRIKDFHIDGLVHVTSLKAEYFHYNDVQQKLVGEKSSKTYSLGEDIRIKVLDVNIDSRNIDFCLAHDDLEKSTVIPKKKSIREKLKDGLIPNKKLVKKNKKRS